MNAGIGSQGRTVKAEAASWVAKLHGPDRNADMEAGFKRWLAEDEDHARAFELATEVWQETSDLPGKLPRREAVGKTRSAKRPWRPMMAVAAALPLAVAIAFGVQYWTGQTLATEVGEQRTMTLSDGTRVELNTSTRLSVRYDDQTRRVILKSGEAWFDVAKHAQRPFIVVAGGQEIRALGTAFVVRQDERATTVTLLEGKVAVSASEQTTVLKPGERLRISRMPERVPDKVSERSPVPVIDTPALEKVTAWQRGQVVFEDTPLNEAASEFNRYSEIKIQLGDADLNDIRVGGTFKVGDIESFAQAIAASHHLEVVDRGSELVLTQ